jgi:P pilus assembly chaperone PapD
MDRFLRFRSGGVRSFRPGRMGLAAGVAIILLVTWAGLGFGVSVAPHAIYLAHDRLNAELTLYNASQQPEEVEIDFLFGYPQATAEGTVDVPLTDSPPPGEPSAHSWLRAFPRRLRVEPGQRRIVRIQANPPEGLPDGEFWSRVVVSSQAVKNSAVAADTTSSMGLTFVFRSVLALNFRNREVSTGLEFDSLWVEERGDSTLAWVDLQRTGNAAFLGTIGFTLSPPGGEAVWERAPGPIAVYRDLRRWYSLPPTGLPPGEYDLTVRITTQREDVNQEDVLPAPPVQRSVRITIS